MKNILFILFTAGLTAGLAISQEKTPAYSPDDVKIVGTISSGQISRPVEYSSTPEYRALVFEGNGHDRVEVTVTSSGHNATVALADSSMNPIASGNGRVSVTLPYHGPDTEAFYIIFKDSGNQPGRFSVRLRKTAAVASTPAVPAAATR